MFVEEEQNGAKESTIRTNRYNLTKIPKGDQNRKINLTNHEHLQKIIRDMESSGFSENYVSAVYYLLRKIFKFAIYKGYIQINIFPLQCKSFAFSRSHAERKNIKSKQIFSNIFFLAK